MAHQTPADSARARQRRRTTKPSGLIKREKELVAARRELRIIQGTGIITRTQVRNAQMTLRRAEASLKRQQDAARRAGRPIN